MKDLSISADNKGNVFICGVSGYPDRAWIKKVRADGGDAWEKGFALGDLSSACAAAFDRAQNIYVAGVWDQPAEQGLALGLVLVDQKVRPRRRRVGRLGQVAR